MRHALSHIAGVLDLRARQEGESRHSLELLSKEVMPKVQHLKPTKAKLAAE